MPDLAAQDAFNFSTGRPKTVFKSHLCARSVRHQHHQQLSLELARQVFAGGELVLVGADAA